MAQILMASRLVRTAAMLGAEMVAEKEVAAVEMRSWALLVPQGARLLLEAKWDGGVAL